MLNLLMIIGRRLAKRKMRGFSFGECPSQACSLKFRGCMWMDSVVVKRCLPLFLACVAHSETKDTQSPCRGAMHYWRGCSYARLPSFFFPNQFRLWVCRGADYSRIDGLWHIQRFRTHSCSSHLGSWTTTQHPLPTLSCPSAGFQCFLSIWPLCRSKTKLLWTIANTRVATARESLGCSAMLLRWLGWTAVVMRYN
jgi:hypothetical protein